MHILEIPSFFPPYGGLFCLDQAKALKALGHEVRILSNVQLGISVGLKDYLSLPYCQYEHELDGVNVLQSYQRGIPKCIRYNANRWVYIVRRMFKRYLSKYGKPDILHAHCAKWAGYVSMLLSEEYSVPYVITEHLPLMLLEEEFGCAPSAAWQIPLLRQSYENAQMVIPVSEELVDDIACYYGKGYKWQYISNTIDTVFFHYHPRIHPSGKPFQFCCIADYYYRKGYDVLFDALSRLQASGFSIELHIAGFLTDSEECLQEIKRLQLKHVNCYGRIDKESVRQLLYKCEALVLPSRSEVQPLVLLEAMSTGMPVVATECVPRCQRLQGCTIVPINDAASLADAMRQIATHSITEARSKRLSEEVSELASMHVVGVRLEKVFNEAIASF